MSGPDRFTGGEEAALHRAFVASEPLVCPRCDLPLDRRRVPPRSDVAYVRDRLWVSCPVCHRSAVLDRRQPT